MHQIRLFISSTFDDFSIERDALQTEVFPKLLSTCNEKGFGFMPIDLRWGVSNEVQLDQSTMDLCLSEVKACTSDPHPDFLILLGDRYGWVPIPYRIDKDEYETIKEKISTDDMYFLDTWYKLDSNEIPASYIIQKRENEYVEYEKWKIVEDRLRGILKVAVVQTTLSENIKEKYFTSATEFEFKEYIQSFSDHKPSSLFVVERSIDAKGIKSTKYFDNNERLKSFKQKIKSQTQTDHYIPTTTSLLDAKTISDNHIPQFVKELIEKLTNSITKEIERIKTISQTSEQQYHKLHKNSVVDTLVGRDLEVADIIKYTESNSNQPYILFGPSGMGKSSIMAEAITETKNSEVIYRFCGVTPESTDIRSLWTSILKQLDIYDSSIHKGPEDLIENTLEEFEHEVSKALKSINEKTVIYLDALDQLNVKSLCLWLPASLPDNLKIIITVLRDENYEDDSYYYKKLFEIISQENFHELKPLSSKDAVKTILENTLKRYNRRLTEDQIKIVQNFYAKVQSPLYLSIIAQELRYCQSDQKEIELATTQKGSIKEFMDNLSSVYHHEKLLIQKVFGYIIASKNSLSESLLYEVLSNDTELVAKVENVYHKNLTKKLPTAVWSRLHYQIKSFIKEDRDGNIYFFHREFNDAAKRYLFQDKQRKKINIDCFQELLSILESMIDDPKYEQDKESITKAYLKSIVHQKYIDENSNIEKQVEYFVKKEKSDKEWVKDKIIKKMSIQGDIQHRNLENKWAKSYRLVIDHILSMLVSYDDLNDYLKDFLTNRNKLAINYKYLEDLKKAIEIQSDIMNNLKRAYDSNKNYWAKYFIDSLQNLSFSLKQNDEINEAIRHQEKAEQIAQRMYELNTSDWVDSYISSILILSSSYKDNSSQVERLQNKAIKIAGENKKINRLVNIYLEQVKFFKKNKIYDEALLALTSAYDLSSKNYKKNKKINSKIYITVLLEFSQFNFDQKNFDNAFKYAEQAIEISRNFFQHNKIGGAQKLVRCIHHLVKLNGIHKWNELDELFKMQNEAIIVAKELYEKNKRLGAGFYKATLKRMSLLHRLGQSDEIALKFENDAKKITVR